MKKVFVCSLLFVIFSLSAWADDVDCLSYKLNPKIELETPDWTKEVVQPLKPMDLLHGDVIATLDENYDIIGDTTSIEDGFCISLKSVHATIGYSDFLVKIDSSHIPESCAYNAVLAHEDEHIRAYLSVIDNYQEKIIKSVYSAANSIMPVFVSDESQIDGALDLLNKKMQEHPDLILINQKIQAEQEIRNKQVDENSSNDRIKQCMVYD
ncbi:MAG TPA: hypothetical protein PKJ33_01195 [Alphaproteobacteria bacterium]|nr:hypothetical protein [Alphaproteobacteria bacterium]